MDARYLILFFLSFFLFCTLVLAQETGECEEIVNEDPNILKPWIGNNNYLLGVLEQHGIFLPEDYFKSLDNNGKYKGKNLELRDVRNPKSQGKGKSGASGRISEFPPGGTIYYLPVKIYNHANSSGQGAFSNQDIYTYFGNAFKIFRTNIGTVEFYIHSITLIPNSPYYNLSGDNARNSMYNDYFDGNTLNIHLVNDAPASGSAKRPGRRLYISKVNASKESTLAHELGHNFGLKHTHYVGTELSGDEKINGEADNCAQEPVSRTMLKGIECGNFNNSKKCEVNADGFCDTPADPVLTGASISGCSVIGTPLYPTDNWGVAWQPDGTNLMSYFRNRECRDKLSYSQTAAIYWELQTSKFNFKLSSTRNNISGPTLLCPNTTYTYTAPNLASSYYLWQVPDGWLVTGQGNQTVNITVPSWAPGSHEIYVNGFPGAAVRPLNVTFNDSQLSINGPEIIAGDEYCRTYFGDYISGSYYNWTVSAPAGSGVVICSGQGTNTVTVKASGNSPSFYLNVSTPSPCGSTAYGSKYITVSSDGGGPIARTSSDNFLIFPNPTSDYLKISLPGEADFEIENVSIIDGHTGEIKETQDCYKSNEVLDVRGLRAGIYLVKYTKDGQIQHFKFLKR
jgi:hypothetical protein